MSRLRSSQAVLMLLLMASILAWSCSRHTEPTGASSSATSAPVPTDSTQGPETAAAPQEAEAKTLCCKECLGASRKDPQAMDLSLVPCADYAEMLINGEAALSPTCIDWFRKQPHYVQDCRPTR